MRCGYGEIDTFVGEVWDLATEGVVSAIHCELHPAGPIATDLIRRAGPEVERELRLLEPPALGHFCVTTAGTLRFKTIIHLAASTLSRLPTAESLRESLGKGLTYGFHQKMRSVSIPALFIEPGEIPTTIAAKAIVETSFIHLQRARHPNRIVLVVPTDYVHGVFKSELERMLLGEDPTRNI
ncbi:macro domain-containing protein [bacterium]|nr:macro domain-containing protein [bacterium]